MDKLSILKKIADIEFRNIVRHSFILDYKLRIILIDGSFIDIHVSQKLKNRFSFHWECKDEKIFRYDNFPDKKARKVKTFPYHFHYKKQDDILENPFPEDLENGFREFLRFVEKQMKE